MAKMIGYARVSTHDQTTECQVPLLEKHGCTQIFTDEDVSGRTRRADRPGLKAAFACLEPGDVLVVWKLDRLGRSMSDLVASIEFLHDHRCQFTSLTEAIDTTTPSGQLMFHVMGAFAQFERDLISERTKTGMNAARARGARIGRPSKCSVQQQAWAIEQVLAGYGTANMAVECGVSVHTIRRWVRDHRALVA